MSGSEALGIAEAVFRPARGERVEALADRLLTLGTFVAGPEATVPIDEGLIALWRGPHSYTGEDVVEFHLHGGPRIVEAALEALRAHGARAAEPGEFTRRAFLNGRIDLAQAEAVCDLIEAQTARAARCALGQLAGGLSGRLRELRERLIAATAEIEAFIDFPEEDLPDADRARIGSTLDRGMRELDGLLADARRGRPLREGVRVAIAGRPNAGKSSLLNAIVGRERSIVAPHPGTTRDTIEAEIDLRGIPTVLIDMAGLRDRPEEIEALGIERARAEIAAADLVVFLLDGSIPIGETDREAFRYVRELPHLILINKNDLPAAFSRADVERAFPSANTRGLLSVSARAREGIGELEREIVRAVGGEEGTPGTQGTQEAVRPMGSMRSIGSMESVGAVGFPGAAGAKGVGGGAGGFLDRSETPLVANSRHSTLLECSRDALRRASEGLAGRLVFELVAVDLREALESLGGITGDTDLSEDILDAIFSSFCIGK